MAGFDGSQLFALAALAGAGVFAHAGLRSARADRRATHESAVFLLLAATSLVLALRQGLSGLAPAYVDAALYQALHVPATMGMVVLMHLTALRLTRSQPIALAAAGLYIVLAASSVAAVFTADFSASTPHEWMATHDAAATVHFGFFTFPALTAAGALVFAAHQVGGEDARRLRLTGLASAVFSLAFTIGAVDPRAVGGAMLGALVLVAAALAHAALVPDHWPGRLQRLTTGADGAAPDEHA